MKPLNSRRLRRASTHQEKRVARAIKGRVSIASGALEIMKGDAGNEKFLVECKLTKKQSFSLTRNTWEKIRREAMLTGKLPAMHLDIAGLRLYVIPEYLGAEFLRGED